MLNEGFDSVLIDFFTIVPQLLALAPS